MATDRPLPSEVLNLVLERLSHNDIVLGGRLACKDAARYFSSALHRTVRLSKKVPSHAADSFQLNAQPHMRLLSFSKKLCLMTAAAASGSEVNMALAWALLRPHLFPELLRPQRDSQGSLEFVYSKVFADGEDPGRAACEQGHPHLVHWMVQHSCPLSPTATLVAAAQHCDLSTLRELWDLLRQMPGAPRNPNHEMLEAAAASTTPDTLAKVEWVLAESDGDCTHSSVAAAAIAGIGCSSSSSSHEHTPVTAKAVISRLLWLEDRGCDLYCGDVIAAAMRLPLRVALKVAGNFILDGEDEVGEAEAEGEEQEQGACQAARQGTGQGAGQGRGVEGAGAGAAGPASSQERDGGKGREQAAGRARAGAAVGPQSEDEEEEDYHPLTYPYEKLGLTRATVGSADSVAKLRWLQGRGMHLPDKALEFAAGAGDLEAVRYLHQECGQQLSAGVFVAAAGSGSVPTAAWLLQAGCPTAAEAYSAAAGRGCLDMVQWLLEEARCPRCSLEDLVEAWAPSSWAIGAAGHAGEDLPAAVQLFLRDGATTCNKALLAAVGRGELQLVRLLHERGRGRLPPRAVQRAAAAGCEAVLEYVVEVDQKLRKAGKPVHDPYWEPAARGDLGTLVVLRRLGVAWGRKSLKAAVHAEAHVCVLKWMVEQGMPAPVELLREVWKTRTWASGADEVWDWVAELAGENWVSGEDSDDGVPPWYESGGDYCEVGISARTWLR